jgi:alpha/beta superfamily hydrolase
VGDVRTIWIEGAAGRLEAAAREAETARAAAVIAHPHPQYGGTLHNPVIFHADRELNRAGWSTLRFNFRGAGSSEGSHDEGEGEVDDVASAVKWLRGEVSDVPLLIVGYSFGSWCGLRYAMGDRGVAAVVVIGMPVRIYAFDDVVRFGRPLAVVQGSHDQFGSPDEVEALLESARPPGRLYRVEGADHLFDGRAPEVARRVVEACEVCLQATGHPDPGNS